MIHSGETGGFALARPALPALAARTSESWNTHCHGPHPRSLRLLPHIPPTHADSAQHPHVQTINNQDEYSQHGPVEGIGLRPTGKREQRKTNETFAETAQSMSRNLGLEYYYSHIPHPSCDITKLSLFFARFYFPPCKCTFRPKHPSSQPSYNPIYPSLSQILGDDIRRGPSGALEPRALQCLQLVTLPPGTQHIQQQ